MALPGVNSVIVPPPSVVVVVEVVVSETWAHANGVSWPLYYHKDIATLPFGGCVALKTKNHISLNKSRSLSSTSATFRFPSRLAGGILPNGANQGRRSGRVASHLHRRWRH